MGCTGSGLLSMNANRRSEAACGSSLGRLTPQHQGGGWDGQSLEVSNAC